jgi:glycosyltransferase involved in cell wall biosynthesis
MKFTQVFRKKNPRFFSIESVFARLTGAWPDQDLPAKVELPEMGVTLKNILFLRDYCKKNPSDLWHMTGDSTYVAIVLPRRRTIVSIHDCGFFVRKRNLKTRIIKWLLLDIPVRHAAFVHAISEKTKEELVRLTGVDPARIHVIPNPVSPLLDCPPRIFHRAEPRLLFIGLTENKNFERACEAVTGIPCRLVIIGKPDDDQLEVLRRRNISFSIFHGLTEAEMAQQYNEADIVFFPSLYEGFGLPVIEGFRAGRVVLTSDISPMKDISEGAACLVDPLQSASIREGLLRLIREEGYREALIRRGRVVAEKYTPEAVAVAFRKFYQEVYDKSCAE